MCFHAGTDICALHSVLKFRGIFLSYDDVLCSCLLFILIVETCKSELAVSVWPLKKTLKLHDVKKSVLTIFDSYGYISYGHIS